MGIRAQVALAVLLALVALLGVALVSWKAALIIGPSIACAVVVVADFDPDEDE